MLNKQITKEQIKDHLHNGMTILVGGFMAVGTPSTIIDAIVESKVKDLILVCNDAGYEDKGIGLIIKNGQCKKLITSHIGLNPQAQDMMKDGSMEIELTPQGTLAEKIRAGGSGLGGVLTPTGLGTLVEQGKEVISVDGKLYLLEKPIKGDLAIIKANICDTKGNSTLLGTTINFNPVMSLAAENVIVESDEIVEHVNPNHVTIPHVVVNHIIQGGNI
ncbi:CoA transferase subunit A [Mycoplasma sp. P36-A1]|uniref:CoA transferase subunit A n=1 Tax=Mycoplasma sp. P36-A1 TaxID=3252900 RepID=UPI003C2E7D05